MSDAGALPGDPQGTRLEQRAELERRAIAARHEGHFEQAVTWFAQAADLADELQDQLNLQIRQACCLLAVERHDEAVSLALVVAEQARAQQYLPELVDALGVIAEDFARTGRLAQATQVLAEAAHMLEQLPPDATNYLVLQNLAVTYIHCGFVEAALELYDRALRLAPTDLDRQFTYANLAAAYHFAALREQDPIRAAQLRQDALYAANAGVDPEGGGETMAVANALAHRAMILAETGEYSAALADAHTAYRTALESGMREEQIVAMSAEAIATWGLHHDPSVLPMIEQTLAMAAAYGLTAYQGPLDDIHVDVLWALDRKEEARAALQRRLAETTRRLQVELAARWEHVRVGIDHRRGAAVNTHDPLTGLPNRRHLATLLPEVLNDPHPVCVGVIDLDGFQRVNDEFGYPQGDAVLQQVASMLEHTCRRGDAVVRLGGDEFVMVLRAASPGDARNVFERVRQMIANRTWQGIPPDVHLTASVGVAIGTGSFDSSRVLAEAASALQRAKRDGRDQIAFG